MTAGDAGSDWRHLRSKAAREGVPHPQIGKLCKELAEVAGAGISVMTTAGNSGVVYASDEVSARIEELQFVLGEGPCLDAFSDGEPSFITDLDDPNEGAASRWPVFVRAAAELGVRAVYAVPLRIGSVRLGVMDLYRTEPGPLTSEQLRAAMLVADVAALSLLHQADGVVLGDEIDRSTQRVQVHQATGMVKVQTGLSIEAALLLLRAHAFAENRDVDDVADDVITGRLRFPQGEG